jgi:hypothetical protein
MILINHCCTVCTLINHCCTVCTLINTAYYLWMIIDAYYLGMVWPDRQCSPLQLERGGYVILAGGIQRIYDGGWDPTDIWWYGMVGGIQVQKVKRVSQSKSAVYGSRTLSALAALGAHSPPRHLSACPVKTSAHSVSPPCTCGMRACSMRVSV